MLQKFRSSILFQLICMVALIFAVLFTTFHAAQAYVRSLSVKGAETLAESLVTQADDALMMYEQELRYYASGACHYPVGEIQMQVFAFAYSTCIAVVDQMAAKEDGTFVARTERLQTLQDLIHLPVHIAQLHLRFYLQRRTLLLGRDMRGYVFLETALEFR